MGPRHRKPEPPTVYVGDHTDRLSGIRSHIHDSDDDRPSREASRRTGRRSSSSRSNCRGS